MDEALTHPIEFTDMLFEAMTRYSLEFLVESGVLEVRLRLLGTSRDDQLPGWIRYNLENSGLQVLD